MNKCNRIVETPLTGAYGEPTAEAVAYLQENLIDPAQKVLNQNDVVTEVTYKTYVSVYNISSWPCRERAFWTVFRRNIIIG